MSSHEIEKALEVWTLQNLLNISIMLGVVVLGLAVMRQYYRSVEKYFTLRVSTELWNALTVLAVDVLLIIIVVIGYLVMNPDIMADIKMAVPFCPVAFLLFTVALLLRLFHGGHRPDNPNYMRAVICMFIANVVNMIGFTFVMEAASDEYLATHPSPFWEFVKTHFRSNADPHGLELAQVTFYVCFALLMVLFVWGFVSAVRQLKAAKGE